MAFDLDDEELRATREMFGLQEIENTKDTIIVICLLKCSTTPIVLILHLTKGIPISLSGCQASVCSGRQKLICGYPPGLG